MVASFGKNAYYINAPLLGSENTIVTDTLRNTIGKFFIIGENSTLEYDEHINTPMEFISSVEFSDATQKNSLRIAFTSQVQDPEEEMQALASVTNTAEEFYDFYFKTNLPVKHSILEEMNANGKINYYVDAHSHYNFYVPTYETLLSNNLNIPENVLPNFYAMYAQGVYEQDNVVALNTLDENFVNPIGEEFLTVFKLQDETVKSRYQKYFKEFAQTSKDLLSNTVSTRTDEVGTALFQRLAAQSSVYIFSDSSLPLLTSEAVKGDMFPLHNEIKFTTDHYSSFSNILRELKIEDELIKYVITHDFARQSPSFGKSLQEYVPSGIPNVPPQSANIFNIGPSPMYNLQAWIHTYLFDEISEQTDAISIGDTTPTPGPAGLSIMQTLIKTLLSVKINKFSENYMRSLKEMMEGKPSYSEDVFYRIVKSREDNPNVPITTYYIPNSEKLDVCRFVDTQVKYGVRYRYHITAFKLILGTKYNYNSISQLNGNTMEIDMGMLPSIHLAEVPFDDVRNLMVLDAPPMPPDSAVVPLKGIANKLIVNLNGTTGDRMLRPIKIESTDQQKIDLQKAAQRISPAAIALLNSPSPAGPTPTLGLSNDDTKIRFRSDDAARFFQVFRTTKRPKSYMDFQGKMARVIDTRGLATSGAFKDTIVPNTKYYYTFRTIDVHNNISNPTPVYEIEMISERGLPFLDINVINMEEEYITERTKKQMSKPMRRYIQILPTVPQGLLNVEESLLPLKTPGGDDTVNGAHSVVLGVADEQLWGKSFRIRFTSKKTGRKIELDVNFNTEHQLKES